MAIRDLLIGATASGTIMVAAILGLNVGSDDHPATGPQSPAEVNSRFLDAAQNYGSTFDSTWKCQVIVPPPVPEHANDQATPYTVCKKGPTTIRYNPNPPPGVEAEQAIDESVYPNEFIPIQIARQR